MAFSTHFSVYPIIVAICIMIVALFGLIRSISTKNSNDDLKIKEKTILRGKAIKYNANKRY
jgi:hypothetical protein